MLSLPKPELQKIYNDIIQPAFDKPRLTNQILDYFLNRSFHISLNVFWLKFNSERCSFHPLNKPFTTLFFKLPLPIFINPLFIEASFHIFQAIFSLKGANPSSTDSLRFSRSNSC